MEPKEREVNKDASVRRQKAEGSGNKVGDQTSGRELKQDKTKTVKDPSDHGCSLAHRPAARPGQTR